MGDVWEGYVESYAFPSGSDAVRIVFDSATGDGLRTGIVVFGAGSPPPPPTDPVVGWRGGVEPYASVAEGFEYRIESAQVSLDGTRVQVVVRAGQLWQRWCELQTPRVYAGDSWSCVPNVASRTGSDCALIFGDGTEEPIDCLKLELCQRMVCECNAAGCTSALGGEVRLDFSVTANRGAGTTSLGGMRNVHLMRRP